MTFTETPVVELKRSFVPSIKKEIVAFANTDGGEIYIGVEDDGNVVGVADPQAVADSINHMIHDDIVPDLSMFAEAHVDEYEGVDLVVVTVHRGPDRPYCIAGKGLRPEGVYVRQGTSAQPLPFDGIRQLLRAMGPESFEAARSLEQDLTFARSTQVFDRHDILFGEAQWKTLGLCGNDGLFTNLGYLLSDQCVCSIKLARFTGTTKAVFQTRREFSGSVLGQVDDAMEMLDLLNNVRAEVGSRPERIETRDYPVAALREALLNAVVHRDYSIKASIGVNVFDDRCEIVSPGGLPRGATREGAFAGVSVARNEGLAALFYRLQWIEAYGTGLMKILGCYEGTGLVPRVDFLDGAVKVVLPNVNAHSYGQLHEEDEEQAWCDENDLTQDERKVLLAVSSNEYLSKLDVAQKVGFTPSKTARLLRDLREAGLIETKGETKARVYRRK